MFEEIHCQGIKSRVDSNEKHLVVEPDDGGSFGNKEFSLSGNTRDENVFGELAVHD